MESGTSFNSIVTDWLSKMTSGRQEALLRGAQRFAAQLAPAGGLEVGEQVTQGHGVAILHIRSGLHRGAAMELTAADYLIGCAEDCDIVLRDAEVAARHCRVTREWSGIVVRDLRPAVGQSVAPRRVTYERGAVEAEYDIGGVKFALRHPPPVREQKPESYKHLTSWLLLLVLIASIAVAVTFSATSGAAKRNPLAASQPAHVRVVATADLLEEARRALADDSLQVEMREGRLLVEGRTSKTALQNRIRVLASDLHGTVVVEDRVVYDTDDHSSPGSLPVRIQGVLIGTPSYFLTDSGVRYFVGGVLPDGAEVVSIDAGAIGFRRAGRVVAYKLQ